MRIAPTELDLNVVTTETAKTAIGACLLYPSMAFDLNRPARFRLYALAAPGRMRGLHSFSHMAWHQSGTLPHMALQ